MAYLFGTTLNYKIKEMGTALIPEGSFLQEIIKIGE